MKSVVFTQATPSFVQAFARHLFIGAQSELHCLEHARVDRHAATLGHLLSHRRRQSYCDPAPAAPCSSIIPLIIRLTLRWKFGRSARSASTESCQWTLSCMGSSWMEAAICARHTSSLARTFSAENAPARN